MINPLNLTFNAGDLLHASSLNSMVGKINELVSAINEVSLNNPGGNTDPITATNLSFRLIGVANFGNAEISENGYIPNDKMLHVLAGISYVLHVYDADTLQKIDLTSPTSADWHTYFPSGATLNYKEWFKTNYDIRVRTYAADGGVPPQLGSSTYTHPFETPKIEITNVIKNEGATISSTSYTISYNISNYENTEIHNGTILVYNSAGTPYYYTLHSVEQNEQLTLFPNIGNPSGFSISLKYAIDHETSEDNLYRVTSPVYRWDITSPVVSFGEVGEKRDVTESTPIIKKELLVELYNIPTIYDVLNGIYTTSEEDSLTTTLLRDHIVDETSLKPGINLGMNRHPEKYLWGTSDNYLLGNEINTGLCIPGTDPNIRKPLATRGSLVFNATDVPKVDGGFVTLKVDATDVSHYIEETGYDQNGNPVSMNTMGQLNDVTPDICLGRDLVLMSMWFIIRKQAFGNHKWSEFCENPQSFFIDSTNTKDYLRNHKINKNYVNLNLSYVSDFGKYYVPDNEFEDQSPYRAHGIIGRDINTDNRSIRRTNVTQNVTLNEGDIFVILRKLHISNEWPAFIEMTIPETANLSVGDLGKWVLPWQITTSTPTDPNQNLLLKLGITNYDYLIDSNKNNTNPDAHWFGWSWYPQTKSLTVPKTDENGYCLWEGSNKVLYKSLGSYPKLVIDPNGLEHDTEWKVDGLTNKCYIEIGNSEIELTRQEVTYDFTMGGTYKNLADYIANIDNEKIWMFSQSKLDYFNNMKDSLYNLVNTDPTLEISMYHSYLNLIYWPYEDTIDNFLSTGSTFTSNGVEFNTNKYLRYGGTNYQLTAFEANKTIEISTLRFSDWKVSEYDHDDGEV